MAFLLAISLTTLAQQHVSPFIDNLAVNLIGFPPNSQVIAIYMSNNGVNIIGPTFTTVNGSAKLSVLISIYDFIKNGYPAMTLLHFRPYQLPFIDGPYS
ncbi:hypothetical protein [Coxiella endosymbiont of Ornithodoros maritimus]|uniref:hypothetical protein n=1 Tax=Coxiella endosymbiont of Ornithodoros maritimus TaxID=1656172 RepID=UPI0022647C39|nr:hypothetical protein [Coxiella endosymbiont of Ornithodoros maritimus]